MTNYRIVIDLDVPDKNGEKFENEMKKKLKLYASATAIWDAEALKANFHACTAPQMDKCPACNILSGYPAHAVGHGIEI